MKSDDIFEPSGFFSDLPKLPASIDEIALPEQGGMCLIFKVHVFSKWMLVKRLKPEYENHPAYMHAFEKEFKIGFQLDHPNIVRYFSKGQNERGNYIMMDYVDGQTLRVLLNKGRIQTLLAERIFHQMAEVLSYLHKHQIYHLDLKPENIIITNKGQNVKLIDFGLSVSDGHTFMRSGTRNYAAPEQVSGSDVDGRSDLYALGKLVTEMYTGSPDLQNISQLPHRLQKIISRCTRTQADERYDSAEVMLSDYEAKSFLFPFRGVHLALIATIVLVVTTWIWVIVNKQQSAAGVPKPYAVSEAEPPIKTPMQVRSLPDVKDARRKDVLNRTNPKSANPLHTEPTEILLADKISAADSSYCKNLAKDLMFCYTEKKEALSKRPFTSRALKLDLHDIFRECMKENDAQWYAFTKKFSKNPSFRTRMSMMFDSCRKQEEKLIKEELYR